MEEEGDEEEVNEKGTVGKLERERGRKEGLKTKVLESFMAESWGRSNEDERLREEKSSED